MLQSWLQATSMQPCNPFKILDEESWDCWSSEQVISESASLACAVALGNSPQGATQNRHIWRQVLLWQVLPGVALILLLCIPLKGADQYAKISNSNQQCSHKLDLPGTISSSARLFARSESVECLYCDIPYF